MVAGAALSREQHVEARAQGIGGEEEAAAAEAQATLAEAGRRLEAALVSLEGVELDSRALRELEEVARFVVEREA